MKGPLLVRVDDRLIHGQVVISWLSHLKCKEIVVVDDEVAVDVFLSEVVRLAAPEGIGVKVLSVEQAVADLSVFEDALVLVKTPMTGLALYRAGLSYDKLVLGGIGARQGRITLYRNISASVEELSALDELVKMGVRPVFQILASDRPVPYKPGT